MLGHGYSFDVAAEVGWVQGILDAVWPTAGDYGFHGQMICEGMFGALALVLLVLIATPLERIRPIERHDTAEARAEIRMEWKLVAAMTGIAFFVQVGVLTAKLWVVEAVGSPGWIEIDPQTALGTFTLTLAYAFYIDLFKYWLHRLEHMVPALWAIHSFHHSAERITVITGARHHWFEAIAILPFVIPFELAIRVPPTTLVMALLILKLPDTLQHLNYKIAWHRVGILVNTPQWHRIHHSVEPRHRDKNFSASLPIMDVIFGTAYYPGPDEYPETGLVPRDSPRVIEGVIWPFRGLLTRALGTGPTT